MAKDTEQKTVVANAFSDKPAPTRGVTADPGFRMTLSRQQRTRLEREIEMQQQHQQQRAAAAG